VRVVDALGSPTALARGEVFWASSTVRITVDNLRFQAAATGVLGGSPIIETPLVAGAATARLTYFRLGTLLGVTVPGEMFASGTRQLKNLLRNHGAAHTMVVGLGHNWLGYLMAPDEYDDPTLSYNKDLSPSRQAMTEVLMAYDPLVNSNPSP
jgi:hypothetical protein